MKLMSPAKTDRENANTITTTKRKIGLSCFMITSFINPDDMLTAKYSGT